MEFSKFSFQVASAKEGLKKIALRARMNRKSTRLPWFAKIANRTKPLDTGETGITAELAIHHVSYFLIILTILILLITL